MKRFIGAGLFASTLCMMGTLQAGGDYLQGWGVAPQTRFYIGGSLGVAQQQTYDDNGAVGKLFGGVRYGHYLGAELGYVKLGEVEKDPEGRLDTSLKNETSGIYAAAMGYMPVAHRTELMGKLGVMYWDSETRKDEALVDNHMTSDESGMSPLLGIGAQYQLSQNMHLRGEWEHVFSAGSDEYETDADLVTVGLSVSTY